MPQAKPPFPVLNRGHPLAQGLVGAWAFYEGSGLRLNDLSGRGNNGALTNGPTWGGGQSGYALSFDGTDDYVSITNSSVFDFGANDFSASWWEYRVSNTNGRAAIVRDNFVGFTPFLFGYSSGGATLQIYMTSNNSTWNIASANSLGPVTLNTWNYFVVTRRGTSFFAYKNAVQTDTWTSALGLAAGGGNLQLGKYTSFFFSGLLDQVRIYNRALSASEVAMLYARPWDLYQQPQLLRGSKTYFYKVSAVGPGGESPLSSEVTATRSGLIV